MEAWTFSVQQQLRSNLVFQLNYSGTAAHHLPVYNNDINRFAGDLIINNDVLTRLNPNFGTINYGTSDGNSVGNFGSASLRMQTSKRISLMGIYTFGKSLDTYSTANSLDSGSVTETTNVIRNGDLAIQRGRSDFDIRQQFSFNGTWSVPSQVSNALARYILGG